jgi:glycosyltransferase involved in cell wall biosynthesis
MKVSVIIPTYNGAFKLPGILNCLLRQTYKDFEVIVAIDGSTDDTLKVVVSFKLLFHSFKAIHQENKGRAAIRNNGAQQATGDLLIFFDDDMRPQSNCIEAHIRHHQAHPLTLMCGAQLDDPEKAVTPFQKYKCHLSNNWTQHLEKQSQPLVLDEMHLTAANFSIPKDLFHELSGFDEALKDNEDLDLAIRAYRKGYLVHYNHAAFAWHDDFHTCASFIKRQKEYIKFHKYVAMNKKEIYSGITRFDEEMNSSVIKKTFYSIWRPDWWVRLVDNGALAFLPPKFQFKIYDWIVHAHTELAKSNEN